MVRRELYLDRQSWMGVTHCEGRCNLMSCVADCGGGHCGGGSTLVTGIVDCGGGWRFYREGGGNYLL